MFRQWFKKGRVLLPVPFYKQDTAYTCGPTCLQMVFEFLGLRQSEKELTRRTKTDHVGTAHGELVRAALDLGFYCYVNSDAVLEEVKYFLNLGLPVIVNFIEPTDEDGHYAVAVGYDRRALILHDPWNGPYFALNYDEFVRRWHDSTKSLHRWLLVVSDKEFNIGRQHLPTLRRASVTAS